MRDSQRSKVYKADSSLECFGRLETVPDIEAFIKRLWQSKRFQDEFQQAWKLGQPWVGDGRGRRRACGSSRFIKMPVWARTKGIVIHELAHMVHIRQYGPAVGLRQVGFGQAWHGWEFCSIYLRLTMILLGSEAHAKLKAAFKANRVKFRAPVKRGELSPELKAMRAARLETARAMKRHLANKRQQEQLDKLQQRVLDLD